MLLQLVRFFCRTRPILKCCTGSALTPQSLEQWVQESVWVLLSVCWANARRCFGRTASPRSPDGVNKALFEQVSELRTYSRSSWIHVCSGKGKTRAQLAMHRGASFTSKTDIGKSPQFSRRRFHT